MASLRNDLIRTACNLMADGRIVFYLSDLMKWTYPETPIGPGFLQDGMDKLLSVMKAVQASEEIPLVPLTEHFFLNYLETSPASGRGEEIEKEARRCVAGAIPGKGPAVGFKVAEKDILTKVWIKYAGNAAVGHMESEWERTELVCNRLGIENPRKTLEERVRKITDDSKGNQT